jgi:hypothetical protein
MDYPHMQNTTLLNNPPKELGVTVTLTAVDPNSNAITIGSTTTDSAGNYVLNFVTWIRSAQPLKEDRNLNFQSQG